MFLRRVREERRRKSSRRRGLDGSKATTSRTLTELTDHMNIEFRNRAFLPVVLPVVILLVVGLLVGGFALTLLYTTHEVAIVLAAVAAAGILLATSLAAASQERLGAGRRAAVVMAGAAPVLMGAFVAIVQPAGITDEMLNINRQPHLVLPDLNLEIAAVNSIGFTANEMVLPANAEVGVVFINDELGVEHNWSLYVSDTAVDDIVIGDRIEGPATEEIIFTAPEAGQYYFQCDVHPNMNGQLISRDDAEPALN